MRALVIYCHPRRGSFTEAVRDVVHGEAPCRGRGDAAARPLCRGFDPVLSAREHEIYEDEAINRDPVASHCDDLAGATR
jgi:NAD(P)H dehydrogenase (quinone)